MTPRKPVSATRSGKAEEETLSVGFLLIPGFALMSYAAAVEPMRAANLLSGRTLYRWWHASPGGKPVAASNGVVILPDVSVGAERDVDAIFVCAGGNPAVFTGRRGTGSASPQNHNVRLFTHR